MKILIVDDDPDCLETLAEALLPAEFSIIAANSPLEALEIAREDASIQLVITDVWMPKMDGLEFIRKLEIIKPDLKVIAVSGDRLLKPMIVNLPNCYAYFHKPVCFFSLIETIGTL